MPRLWRIRVLEANRTRDQLEAEVAAMFVDAADADAREDALFGDARGDELPDDLVDPRRRKARLDAVLGRAGQGRSGPPGRGGAGPPGRRAAGPARSRPPRSSPQGPPRSNGPRRRWPASRPGRRSGGRLLKAAAAARGDRKPRGPAPGPGRGVVQAEQRLADVRAKAPWAPPPPATRHDPAPPRANTTDPDSRIMKTPTGWVQGYNTQAAVNQHGVVLAAAVTQDGNDVEQCQPMMVATQTNLHDAGVTEPIGTMLFDAGYLSEDNLTVEGPDRLIATGKAWKLQPQEPTSGHPPPAASPIEEMQHRLRTPEGRAAYSQRQHTVEPVFGTIKEQRGYPRFTRRGLDAVHAEWQLITVAHNGQAVHPRPHPRLTGHRPPPARAPARTRTQPATRPQPAAPARARPQAPANNPQHPAVGRIAPRCTGRDRAQLTKR